eukprot:gene24507-10105_t
MVLGKEPIEAIKLAVNTVKKPPTYIASKRLVPRQSGSSVKEAGRSIEEARKGAKEACQQWHVHAWCHGDWEKY